ncbi:MAG: lipopolysaccharide biosynthesis protein [Spirochaetaceae bacterium]|jgi:uncharacterized protein involved in exopolysaccharide biosynthesis|nr:lipopolysaccharide biosynthesis protein [Spirochaetaceae bacterium]
MDIEPVKESDDEISLIDLFAVLWHRRIMIIAITAVAAVGSVVYSVVSLILPPEKTYLANVYTPQAFMLINSSSQGGGMSGMLNAAGLGGLAGLAGVSVGGGVTSSGLAVYLVSSNYLLDAVVDNFDLIERYGEKSPRAESRKALKKLLKAEIDAKSGVFTIEFTDKDPVFAQSVVNFCVLYLEKRFDELGVDKNKLEKANLETNLENTLAAIKALEQKTQTLAASVGSGSGALPAITLEINLLEIELAAQKQIYTQLRVQLEMLKVTMASEKPVFQILEMAEIPDKKSGPSRGLLCIIVTLGAGFLSVFLAFILNAIEGVKKDPEAMAKLQGNQYAN